MTDDTNLQLTAEEAGTLLRVVMDFSAKAEDGQPKQTFAFNNRTEYKNMTRAQFQVLESALLQVFNEISQFQSASQLPDICNVTNPCEENR